MLCIATPCYADSRDDKFFSVVVVLEKLPDLVEKDKQHNLRQSGSLPPSYIPYVSAQATR